MAARRRGDYAAMAPLAIEADAQKTTLENATVGFAERLGLTGALLAEDPVDGSPATTPAPEPTSTEMTSDPAITVEEPPSSTDYVAAELTAETQMIPEKSMADAELAEAQPERRRLRALIRQMRPTSDEAPATR